MTITLAALCDIVREAKPIMFDRELAAQSSEKGANDFVTAADVGVQNFIKKRLIELSPDCKFMGEEEKDHSVDKTVPTFILDPIDGTTNYIHDLKMSVISLALVLNGKPVMGVVYNPYSEEMFCAEAGKGAYLNGQRIHVAQNDLAHSLIGVGTSPYNKATLGDKTIELVKELFVRCSDIRRSGSAAQDIVRVACGRFDMYFELRLAPWDYAAAGIILTEAGGCIVNASGAELDYASTCPIVAATPSIIDEVLAIVEKYCQPEK